MGLLSVYFKDGRVFSYEVSDSNKAREHMDKIWKGGYRHAANEELEWFGPHYIDKIKYSGKTDTKYPDTVRGT